MDELHTCGTDSAPPPPNGPFCCYNCGKPTDPAGMYCRHCGAPLQSAPLEKPKKRTGLIVALCILAVLLILLPVLLLSSVFLMRMNVGESLPVYPDYDYEYEYEDGILFDEYDFGDVEETLLNSAWNGGVLLDKMPELSGSYLPQGERYLYFDGEYLSIADVTPREVICVKRFLYYVKYNTELHLIPVDSQDAVCGQPLVLSVGLDEGFNLMVSVLENGEETGENIWLTMEDSYDVFEDNIAMSGELWFDRYVEEEPGVTRVQP